MIYRRQVHGLTIEMLTQLVDRVIIGVVETLPAQVRSGHEAVERFNLKAELANAQKAHEWLGHFIAAALADAPSAKGDEDAFLKT